MTAAMTRYGITRTRSDALLGTAGRLLALVLLCALIGHAHTLAICCATIPTHTHAGAAGSTQPPADVSEPATPGAVALPCSADHPHSDSCDAAEPAVRVAAHPQSPALAVAPDIWAPPRHTTAVRDDAQARARPTGPQLISLRI
ncbi:MULTISPECIES: hypothetical protein [Catenuloplanes]|uniref:Uncharacterized protein n=1 Tax=Catenuloplanes niger TaxID=587534 RepID=A0AAE3ZNS3_9ACTN|nr:hypothetical protein [Catenuloplanes niger]MDR7322651.1 hypothetical protein [Catenuloplanes niger]